MAAGLPEVVVQRIEESEVQKVEELESQSDETQVEVMVDEFLVEERETELLVEEKLLEFLVWDVWFWVFLVLMPQKGHLLVQFHLLLGWGLRFYEKLEEE